MSAPTRRRPRSRRRALLLLAASGVALVGVLTLAGVWLGLGVNALRVSATGEEPCLVASETDSDVRIRFDLVPARALCVRETGTERDEVVLASAPTGVVVGGIVFAVVGVVGTVLVLLPARRRQAPPSGDVPADRPVGAAGTG
ncbi:hypothetical protein J1G42_12890 [Cellulomonas sp. zg-ZUI222]|uniref:hypothetical protein n=1 Tax=Cellulomonas wangleii TaxID=2816956 RepID=UPI001A93DDBE|nr:hypothetical protein [Cellulomonas wangleii]MBO0921721.1 hypothetical protein [Cellulomonas wangleii]